MWAPVATGCLQQAWTWEEVQGSAGALSHYLHLLLPSLQSLRTGCDQVFPSRVGTLLAFCCRVLSALQVVRGSALVSLF